MDESVAKTIRSLSNWKAIASFEKNTKELDRLTPEVAAAIEGRAKELAREVVKAKTNLPISGLLEHEEKILSVVCEFIALRKSQGLSAEYTLRQLANRGYVGAAEAAVSRNTPTDGYTALADENRKDLTYEQIILDHPEEFSPRAVWFARKTLKIGNSTTKPPTDTAGTVQIRCLALLDWLQKRSEVGGGQIAPYSNADAALAMGMEEPQRFGRVHGNIQSRLDYACYQLALPPLGLTAETPFADAWGQQDRTWKFPIASMQKAAQEHVWITADFDGLRSRTAVLPGQAYHLWRKTEAEEESQLKAWAFGLGTTDVMPVQEKVAEPAKRNPPWTRDELILALDLYLTSPATPPGKDSAEVNELSAFLEQMGRALGEFDDKTFRNANGVYMKMMNFRRLDPEFTREGKVGLQRGNKDEEVVWNEFSSDHEKRRAIVAAIRKAVEQDAGRHELSGVDDPGIVEAPEGRTLTKVHIVKERNRRLIEEKKQQAQRRHGRLFCEACDFCFSDKYGEETAGIIDCHHTKPVHTLMEGDTTHIDDLALLCANCHRVVHSRKQWLSLEELRDRLRSAKAT